MLVKVLGTMAVAAIARSLANQRGNA
jgi:hypothetical protein